MEKERIQFKPLHDGMGFHPFSDGLPYAPESKKSSGAGATAAGRPRFAHSPPSSPAATARQLRELEKKQTQPTVNSPVISAAVLPSKTSSVLGTQAGPPPEYPRVISHSIRPALRTPQEPLRPPRSDETASATPDSNLNSSTSLGGQTLRRRAFAYAMDTIIHAGFWLGTNLTALLFFHFQVDFEIVESHLSQFVVFFLISQWLFIALQEVLFGTTIGKSFFNLEFKRNHRSLFLRSIVFMLGLAGMGLGLIYRPQDRLGQIQLKSKIYPPLSN